jgi:hypothetical protein
MYTNRLTVVGGRLRSFQNGDWLSAFAGRHAELLEAGRRFVCTFETETDPLPGLQHLSRLYPGRVFLLEYETTRCKGLARAKAGRLTQHRIRY